MLSVVNGLQEHYDLLIYLIIAVIFAFILVIVVLFSNKKKKYTNQLEKLKSKYKKVDELPITTAINKIEELSIRNISFSGMASAYIQRYLEYGNKFNQPIMDLINSINALINDGKYETVEDRINSLDVLISSYKKDAELLLGEIQEATSDEEPLNHELERIRKSYKDCVRKYQDNANDLHLVYPKIKEIMERISSMISEAEDNIQTGIYNETKELVNRIDSELDYLHEYLRVMPQLINLATKIIVRKLNNLIEKNNIMQDDFPLHHLMPFKKIEKLKRDVENSIERIKDLDYEGVEPLLREINNSISDLSMALDHEKECKKEYDSKCENLYYTSDCTIRDFDRVKKDIEKVLLDYDCTDEITNFIRKCEVYQKQLKDDKQTMDNNIYGHQPYSVRLENMNKLSTSITTFQEHLDTFANVAKSLEEERTKCVHKIKGYINYLRLSQITLEKTNLPGLEKRYKETISNIEDLISRLINSLRKPYKVSIAKDICRSLDNECKDLYGKVKYSQRLMVFCEKIIVIASRYRDKFQEVDYAVNRASFYFLDGDFEACKNIIEKLSSYGIVFPKFSEIEA